jgi:hypothetical protein
MMLNRCLRVLVPLALIACSTSPRAVPAGILDAAEGTGGSSSGNGGGSGGGAGIGADATTSGGDGSGGGSDGAAATADGGPSGGDGSTDVALSGDGGSRDGSTDAAFGGDGGSNDGGACAGLFCEDFEQGQLDPAKWDVLVGAGGTQMVDQKIVAHGKYAFHVHGTGARGDFATILTKSAPLALRGAGPVFGRAYLYATTNLSAHIQLGFAGTTRNPTVAPSISPLENGINFNYMEFAHYSGSWQLGFDLFAPAPTVATGFVEEASYPPGHDKAPAGTWSCIEWELGDDPDMMVLWVDGKQIDQFDVQHIDFTTATRTPGSVLNGKSSGIIGGFAFFGFGFHSWGNSAAVDRYYDDIVLDTKRVNCLQ